MLERSESRYGRVAQIKKRKTVVMRNGIGSLLGANAWHNLPDLNLGIMVNPLNQLLIVQHQQLRVEYRREVRAVFAADTAANLGQLLPRRVATIAYPASQRSTSPGPETRSRRSST